MLPKIFGEVLKKLRKDKSISQEKLAELCNLDSTYISLLERGKRQPTLTTFFKISSALKTDPKKFIELIVERYENSN